MNYRQCLLVKNATQQVAWIPANLARIGRYVRIADSDGWKVMAVYGMQDAHMRMERSTDYRYQRQASDI